jgi:hypothetical protein
LEDYAVEELISRSNHDQIEDAILNLDDPPTVVNRDFVRKMARYVRRYDKPPKDMEALESTTGTQGSTSYGRSPTSGEMETKQPGSNHSDI